MVKNLQFYNFLSAGGSAKNVAKIFAIEMLSTTVIENPNWWYEVGCTFIKQLFQSVGLKCSMTVENLLNMEYDSWRQENLTYIFTADSYKLRLIDEFQTELGHYIEGLEQDYQKLEKSETSAHISPLVNYSAIVYNWLNIATEICTEDSFKGVTDKFFREPIAVLSFFFLKSVAPLELKFKGVYPMLKQYSSILSWVMSYGLLYRRIHKHILKGMLDLISNYHEIFIVYESKQWIFFQRVILCDTNNTSTIQLLGFLTILMEKWSAPETMETGCSFYLRELTNILMKKKMLNSYNTIITTEKSTKILIAALNFLNVLQSKLISTEGFTKNFLNGVLMLVLENRTVIVRKKAAELYSEIVRPQKKYDIILHILSVFTSAMSMDTKYFLNWTLFYTYINELLAVFPMIKFLDSYLSIIKNANVKVLVRKVAAKALLYQFNQNQHKVDLLTAHGLDILVFVSDLPEICHNNEEVFIPIVTELYSQFDCQYFAKKIRSSHEILSNLEDYGLELIINDKLDIIDIEAMIINLLRFIEITKNNTKILALCSDMFTEFRQQENYLAIAQTKSKEPTKALLSNYYNTLACLNAITQNQLTYEIDFVYILTCLFDRFIPESMYDKVIEKTKINLYHVAYPLMTKIIVLLSRDDYDMSEHVFCMEATMINLLIASNPNDHILCGELFKSLILMHIEFASNTSCQLNLSATNYNILLGSLQLQLSKTFNNIKRTYVDGMFESFKHLIRCSSIVLPNSTIWKLLLHYKLNNHIFNNDLRSIIELFLAKRTRNYSRALPVIIYKLHMTTPTTSNCSIRRVIMGHLEIIKAVLSPLSAWYLKQHCFLSTLEIMNKAANLISANDSQNRLLPLRNLLLLIKGMRLTQTDFNLIDVVVLDLNGPTLSIDEKNTLFAFRSELERYKNVCIKEAKMAKKTPVPSDIKFHTFQIPTNMKFPWRLDEPSIKNVSIENNEMVFNEGVESTDDEYDESDSDDTQFDLEGIDEGEEVNLDSDEYNEDFDMEEENDPEEAVI